jgi:hypothetical protein
MKQNRTLITVLLFGMTVVLLGTTIYISTLLNDANKAPTQIRKTKASAQTYNKTVNLQDSFGEFDTTGAPTQPPAQPTEASVSEAPTIAPTVALPSPTRVPTLIAKAVTQIPTTQPTAVPTIRPTDVPTPTLSPLLAYKSTSVTQAPTLIPIKETGGQKTSVTQTPTPTKKIMPTPVSTLPESGWVQTSTILFIVASTTILFSLLF